MINIPSKRRDQIIEILKSKEYAEIPYLSQKFSVSEMTIRRDIEKLESEGKVNRVYGGVKLVSIRDRNYELSIEERLNSHSKEKQIISIEAAKFINDGDVIAFDASTSALELSRYIKFKKKITVVTNNIKIAGEVSEDPNISTILLGGFVRQWSCSIIGSSMNKYLESIFIDKAFISCKSLNFTEGVTDSLIDEGEAKQSLIERSNQLYVLADHSKINTLSFFKICSSDKIHTIITDSNKPFDQQQQKCIDSFREIGVNVIMAQDM
jgi:DeoR family fructose operon transcriptional repressor